MADNSIPESYDPIVQFLEDGADGAHTHGAAIGLKQNDEAALRASLTPLVGIPPGPGNVPPGTPGVKDKWNTAKAAKVTATAGVRTAESNGKTLVQACVSVLGVRLGKQWNSQWQQVGFTNNSLAAPDHPLALLQQIRTYFSTNPTHEAPGFPLLPVTAAACEAAAQAISDAVTARNQSIADAGNAKKNLEAGIADGRTTLGGLRDELTQLLDNDDERWYAFGFDKPSDPNTPAVPEGLVLIPGASGSHMMFIDWGDSRRGDSYRVLVKNTANPPVTLVDEIVKESEFNLNTVASGTAIKVTITARNKNGGESAESDPASGTVP